VRKEFAISYSLTQKWGRVTDIPVNYTTKQPIVHTFYIIDFGKLFYEYSDEDFRALKAVEVITPKL